MLLLCACLAQGAWAQIKITGPGFLPDENGTNLDDPEPAPQRFSADTNIAVTARKLEEERLRAESDRKSSAIVTIAHVGPTSGALAHLGKDNENGAIMAVEELNAAGVTIGGKKVTIRLMTEDDGADPRKGTAVAQKLADAKVVGVIGHLNSGTSIPASKIYNDAGIPQISPSATNPKYTRQGYKTAFRLPGNDFQMGIALGKFVVNQLNSKSIAVIDDRTAYGAGLAEAFSLGVKGAGGSIVTQEFTTERATDFSAILTSIKGKRPDVVFFGGMDAVAGPMIRQMKSLGINTKLVGGDGICSNELVKLAGDAVSDNQVFCAEAGGVEAGSKFESDMNNFYKKFRTRFGVDVQVYSPYVYDSVRVMIAAMVKADSSDPAKYLPVLAATKDFQGVTGAISFDYRGDIVNAPFVLKSVRNGGLKVIGIVR